MYRWHCIYPVLMLATSSIIAQGFEECKWSNEGCEENKECCSESCVQPHPGTNSRCAMSPLHGPCLFDYQCVSRYVCGSEYTCCSAAWGTCTEKRDCCNPNYKCIEVPGFVYKRCLRKSFNCCTNAGDGSTQSAFILKLMLTFVAQMLVMEVLSPLSF